MNCSVLPLQIRLCQWENMWALLHRITRIYTKKNKKKKNNSIKVAQDSCDVTIGKPVLKVSRRIASAIVMSHCPEPPQ